MTTQCTRRRLRHAIGILHGFVLIAPLVEARRWTDIVLPQNLILRDTNMDLAIVEEDPFLDMETSTQPPIASTSPQDSASIPPLDLVTFVPTSTAMTDNPEISLPTPAPTNSPTTLQTSAQTINQYPENPVPTNPPSSYFNYDPRPTNPYGPGYPQLQRYNESTLAVTYENNGWATTQAPADFYWDEFDDERGFGPWQGVLGVRQPERNRCDGIGKQSPIDVRPNGATCVEHHQVRVRPGDFKVTDAAVEKQIHPNKLRLKYQRRPCADINLPECSEPDPPHADFPNNWGGYIDLLHVDFKVPSEHMIHGQRYDAEMQIYHLHPGRRRTPTVSVVIQATPNGYNFYLQAALDAFEYVYNVDRAQCSQKRKRERQLISKAHQLFGKKAANNSDYDNPHTTDYDTWAAFSTDLDDPEFEEKRAQYERLLQYGIWNPHHPQLVPSIYFYGYEGAITEPPCGEWVSWFVCDTQMIISYEQLERMKKLIFTHIDGDCNPTSVHYRQSVARPIQDTGGRPVWHCTQNDFLPDNKK